MHHKKKLLAVSILAIGLSACASGPEGRQSPGEYLRDSGITTRVKTAFIRDSDIHAMDIHVETMNGTVRLTGQAASQREIDRAAEIAASVAGVESVRNEIQLREKEEVVTETTKP